MEFVLTQAATTQVRPYTTLAHSFLIFGSPMNTLLVGTNAPMVSPVFSVANQSTLAELIWRIPGVKRVVMTERGVEVLINRVHGRVVNEIYDAIVEALMISNIIPNSLHWPDYALSS